MPPTKGWQRRKGQATAKTRGTGLLMMWSDIDPQFEAEYRPASIAASTRGNRHARIER
jgi:hypothetical protein